MNNLLSARLFDVVTSDVIILCKVCFVFVEVGWGGLEICLWVLLFILPWDGRKEISFQTCSIFVQSQGRGMSWMFVCAYVCVCVRACVRLFVCTLWTFVSFCFVLFCFCLNMSVSARPTYTSKRWMKVDPHGKSKNDRNVHAFSPLQVYFGVSPYSDL